MDMAPKLNGNLPVPSIVRESVFIGIIWAGMVTSFICMSARLYARVRSFGRLWLDDLFVFLAWSMVFTTTILWHFTAHKMFLSTAVASGQMSIMNHPTYIQDTEFYLKRSIGIIILFYTSLACIKISFLLFFRRLLGGVYIKALTIYWWVVLGITIATWLACCADIEYKCLAGSLLEIGLTCIQDWSVDFQRATLIANCVMDVTTDVLIMSFPIAILWNVRVSVRRKFALAGLFSLTIVTISFSIIRVAVVSSASKLPDISWLYLWSSIEPPVAVIVSCLASFRTLFARTDSQPPPTGGYFISSESGFLRRLLNSGKRNVNIAVQSFSGRTPRSKKHFANPDGEFLRTETGDIEITRMPSGTSGEDSLKAHGANSYEHA